jgi:hypothetical protein
MELNVARKDKPGEWMIAIGALMLLGGIGLAGGTVFEVMPEYDALRDHGMVANGIVMDKEVSKRTSRKGRRTTEHHTLIVGYNPNTARPFNPAAEADEDTPTTLPPASKAMTGEEVLASIAGMMDEVMSTPAFPNSHRMGVSKDEYETTEIGTRISITFLPEAPSKSQLTEDVRSYSPVGALAGSIVLVLIGGWACMSGAQRRHAFIATSSS